MRNLPQIKNIIFLGRKLGASRALRYLIDNGFKVKFVVAPTDEISRIKLKDTANKFKIPVVSDAELYRYIQEKNEKIKDIDLVISYLYNKKIKTPLYELGKINAINFHPGHLPEYRGWASYNYAILNQVGYWGASAHFIVKEFDAGPIIKVIQKPIDQEKETAFSLEKKTQAMLLDLFKEVMGMIKSNKPLITQENNGGTSWTKKEMEEAKYVDLRHDSPECVNRKIRAFFFPPYSGAKIKIGQNEYTLINEFILNYLHDQSLKKSN